MAGTLLPCHDAYIMMSRTQISLPTELHRRASQRAAQLGLSLAGYVRRLLQRDLGEPEAVAEPAAVFDLGRSDGSDIASEKDRLVGDAVDARRARKRSSDE